MGASKRETLRLRQTARSKKAREGLNASEHLRGETGLDPAVRFLQRFLVRLGVSRLLRG